MAAAFNEWLNEKISELRVVELRISALEEIRKRLDEETEEESLNTLVCRLLSAPEVFNCIENGKENNYAQNNPHIMNVAHEIIIVCLNKVKINTEDEETANIMRNALVHSQKHIRAAALHSILKELRQQASACDVKPFPQNDLLFYVLDELRKPDTESCVPAINILAMTIAPRLSEPEMHEALAGMLKEKEEIRCRVYELAVGIAKRNVTNLKSVEFILDTAISELDSDDILLQASVLEILVLLAEQIHGLLFLERRNVFEVLSDRIKHIDRRPLDNMLVPSIMKFFGKIARVHPRKMITEYKHMVLCLFESLHTADPGLLPVAMDTLANLADTQQGKLLLDEHYNISIREVFETYSAHLKNLKVDLKIRLLNTLEAIFIVENTVVEEVSEILKKWCHYLNGGSKLQIILDYCRTPFPDVKIACLSFVKALCDFSWGVESVKKTAGFVEYLLDRRSEKNKDVKYLKWECIQKLSQSDLFDIQLKLQLIRYVNEGPYNVAGEMNVAVEGSE